MPHEDCPPGMQFIDGKCRPVDKNGIRITEGAFDKIKLPIEAKKISTKGLSIDHNVLHRAWALIGEGKEVRLGGKPRNLEELIEAHAKIADEMWRRNMEHPMPVSKSEDLDRISKKFEKQVEKPAVAEKAEIEHSMVRIIKRPPLGLFILRDDLLFRIVGEPGDEKGGEQVVLVEGQRAPSEALEGAPKGTWDVSVVEVVETKDPVKLAKDRLGHRIMVARQGKGVLIPVETILAVLEPAITKADHEDDDPKKVRKQADPYLVYPNENQTYRYVAQHHYRGRTAHLDLRLETEGKRFLIGWTIADQVAGAFKEPIDTVAKAMAADRNPSNFKLNPRTFVVRPRRTAAGVDVPANLQSFRKGKQPPVWLTVAGQTQPFPAPGSTRNFPGIFTIIGSGRVQYGRQDDKFHEYFMSGGGFKGRLLFRAINVEPRESMKILRSIADEFDSKGTIISITKVAPPADQPEGERIEETTLWVMIQPKDQKPNVLDRSSVRRGFRPPVGKSALPQSIRNLIRNPEFQYWNAANSNERNKRHDALLDVIDDDTMRIDFNQLLKAEKQSRPKSAAGSRA